METEPKPLRGHILISHTHWDHIQGWPFFAPLFVPGNEWDVYAPHGLTRSVQEILAGQMEYTYFPVLLDQLRATIRYHDLVEGVFQVGDIKVKTQYLHHPTLTLGYRLEADGVAIVYACDHEPSSRQMAYGLGKPNALDQAHVRFLAGADLVIHDAQYTADEYQEKISWGHSTVEYAVEIARLAGVKSIALTHHDPLRDDEAVDNLVERMTSGLRGQDDAPSIFAAAEGQVLELAAAMVETTEDTAEQFSALTPVSLDLSEHSALVAVSDSTLGRMVIGAIAAEGVRANLVTDGNSALRTVLSDRPSLVILDSDLSGIDGLGVCRAIRAQADTYAAKVPIIILSDREDPGADAADATAWLIAKPFSSIYARSLLRAWLLRQK